MSLNLLATKSYSPYFFASWRILFGLYLFWYFVCTIPYGKILYSPGGVAPLPESITLLGATSKIVSFMTSGEIVTGFIALLAISSVFFMLGVARVPAALLLWFGSTILLIANPLTEDPSTSFLGLILLLTTLVPSGEGLSPLRLTPRSNWHMPLYVYGGAWLVLGAAYTASGLDRLFAPSWQDGTAVYHMYQLSIALDNPVARIIKSLPPWTMEVQTYASMGAFILALPLVLNRHTRLLAWVLYSAMFSFIACMLDLTQVILGILLYQIFLFDIEWLKSPVLTKLLRRF